MRDSWGTLHFSRMENGSKKLVVAVDQGIVNVLFALTPKYYHLQRQMFPAHISVVRNEWFESPMWGKREGEGVYFTYDPRTREDRTYHWVRAWSERLIEVRAELGLPPHRLGTTLPPDGELCFHITIGNTKRPR
jgi:hypothetical protein